MIIKSSFQKDTQSVKMKPGSYEWWYFDAQSADGYSIVVIFYEGNPFSRRYIHLLNKGIDVLAEQFPAISISVYKDSKPIYYAFEEFDSENASFSADEPAGSTGNSGFEGEMVGSSIQYKLRLNHTLLNGDSLKGELLFESETGNLKQFGTSDADEGTCTSHEWNLVIPKCDVSGSLAIDGYHQEKIEFIGLGYHDHNRGDVPMKETFNQWYWGRYHTENASIVYYLMEENGKWDEKAWLIEDGGLVRRVDQDIIKGKPELSLFGLKCSRTIRFKMDETDMFLQKGDVLDNGPFYIRFSGKLILKKGDEIEVAEGFSEYIYPARIYDRKFWPLVNMRIQYPKSNHWVQKSPILYRWTW